MSLSPGLYKATVRGVPDQIVMLTDLDREDPWVTMLTLGLEVSWRWHAHDMVLAARPLIVLDFDSDVFAQVVWDLRYAVGIIGSHRPRSAFISEIADQIEAQTKPPRIPEPGLWGVVEAAVEAAVEEGQRRIWLHFITDWYSFGGGYASWSDLIDPVLIRPGIESDGGAL